VRRTLFAAWSVGLAVASGVSADRGPEARVDAPSFELVESAPDETILDHPAIRNTADVWLETLRGAARTIDVAAFYTSNAPGEPLEAIVAEIERAAARGVRVRYLGEESFYRIYPETLDRLAAQSNVEVRRLTTARLMGGVMHAKYFIVDARVVYVGSANFDWRSLRHIQEIGVRIESAEVASAFLEVFGMDWALAGGQSAGAAKAFRLPGSGGFPVALAAGSADSVRVTPVFSPGGWLPRPELWDEPRLVELLDGARREVALQLLTYSPLSDERYYDRLESALRRAAARGVSVRILLSDWVTRPRTLPFVKSLGLVPHITVRLVTIPESSRGFIPYARVVHAKYLLVDGTRGWIGTSNWEEDYFMRSRNAGVVFEGGSTGETLRAFFETGWNSPYAHDLRPEVEYAAPRISE
jgi:phosphatidylserine/phosphatidylglycerophosphate/cardiolipin synthase-like enzyme